MKLSSIIAQLALVGATIATPEPQEPKVAAKKPIVFSDGLMKDIQISALRAHERQLQDFANTQSPPNRVFGGPAHNLTVQYIANQLRSTGYYNVRLQRQMQLWFNSTQSLAVNKKPIPAEGGTYSPSGTVIRQLSLVKNLGCNASDFPGAVSGKIALISRGTCTFSDKVALAGSAGAKAAVIYNNEAGELSATLGTPTNPLGPYVPVVFITQDAGAAIAQKLANGVKQNARVFVDSQMENRTTYNVIATTRQGDQNNVITVGAHTDSVNAGPGINDNGSGTSGILAVAKALSRYSITNAVRFCFWTAEEFGLLGSEFYANSLSEAEADKIVMNLNFDMIASPNYVYSIYDGDGSAFNTTGPPGSAEIEALFEQYFDDNGEPHIPTAFDGRSDYGPFLDLGIAAGGLFTGAEEIKTKQQQRLFGGIAGEALDPCYHQACDTINNLNYDAFILNARAIAFAVARYARSLSGFPAVNERRAIRKRFIEEKLAKRDIKAERGFNVKKDVKPNYDDAKLVPDTFQPDFNRPAQ